MRRHGHTHAFTLMEVLIALAVFTLGAVAIAAIFPAAVYLQKQTINEVMASHVAESAVGAMLARGIDATLAPTEWADIPDQRVSPVPTASLDQWTLGDRSYPAVEGAWEERQFYWVPLLYDLTDDPPAGPTYMPPGSRQWLVYYFVLRREDRVYSRAGIADDWANYEDGRTGATSTIPGVQRITGVGVGNNPDGYPRVFTNVGTDVVGSGDMILDEFGGIYTVVTVNDDDVEVDRDIAPKPFSSPVEYPGELWAAPPGSAKHIGVMFATDENQLIRD